MATLHLVRHGKAAGGWGEHADPGLDDIGRAEAHAVAERLSSIGPLPLLVSPLRRTRETAEAFEARWGVTATVDRRVGEIPPPPLPLSERPGWLRAVMARPWPEQDDHLKAWRQGLLDALHECEGDTVVVTHFVVINAAIGAATDDPRLVCRTVANCSVTTFETTDGGLRLLELGDEVASTEVLPGTASSGGER